MMKHTKIAIIMVSIVLFFTACQELEMEIDTAINDELLWNNPSYIENYVIDIVS